MRGLGRRELIAGAAALGAAPAFGAPKGRGVDPIELGAAGDGRADDLVHMKRAVEVAAERNLPLRITQPHYLGLKTAAHSIQLQSGTTLSFEGGSIRYDYIGSPVLWAADAQDITILRPNIVFSGRMPLKLPPTIPDFFDHYLKRTSPMPGRELMTALGFYGVQNLQIISPRFQAARFEPDTLIIRCIVVGDHNDGRPSRNVLIEDFQADGFYMGVLGWNVDGLTIRGMRTKRWGQLNTTKYDWDCPAHPIYIAPLTPSRNVTCTDLVDEGLEISPWYGAGSTSWKFTGVAEGLRLARLWSRRSAGLLDFHGRNFVITDLDWAGDAPEAIKANKVIRAIPYAKGPGEFTGGLMRNVQLRFPEEMDDNPVMLGYRDGANIDGCSFENWSLTMPGTQQRSSNPLIVTSMSRSHWRNLWVTAPAAQHDLLALRIDNGGVGNDVDLHVRSPAPVRVMAAQGNRVQVSRA